MLPSICLIDIYFNKDLTRQNRLELCNLAFGLTTIHFILSRGKCDTQTTSKFNRKGITYITSFQDDECAKIMHLTASFACIISQPYEVKLGRLGTHILEHLFGYIRRICQGNDEKSNFKSAIIRYINNDDKEES